MNLKATLFCIFSLLLFSLGAWIIMLFNIDPYKTDILTHLAFLSSLFLWLSCLITLLEYRFRLTVSNRELIYAHLPIALRHGLQISCAVTMLLAFQLMRVLNLFDAVLILAVILTSELYFNARTRHA